ncbi:MAG: phage tail tape measure protein, partial [Pigmentiphaga sp.]
MPNPSGIRAGQAFVELFADDSRLVRGLNAASKRLKDWGRSVTAAGQKMLTAGMAAVGGLFGATGVFAGMGDTIHKMSLRTGVSAESLSELGFAAEQSGADLTTLEAGLRRMQRAIGEAIDGSQTAVDALAALGLSVKNLTGLSPEEQFKLIADRIAEIEDPTLKAATAMELFGDSGTMLLPLMEQGAAGIEALQRQARELALTISTEDANAAASLTDALNILWRVLKQGVFTIGSALAPALKDFAERAASVIKSVADWIKQNKAVVVTVFKVAAAVVAGGAALIALGGILSALGFAFATLASIVTGVGTALGVIGTAIGAILSPVGLVIAALASLGGYLLYVSGAGQQALSWLGQQFVALRDTALAAWKGISDALAAGDIGLAARILWLTLKMEWQKGVAWLTDKWIGFKEAFMTVATEAVYGTAKILTSAWAGLQTAWV